MPKNLFYKNFFIIQYTRGNKIIVTILIDICTTRYYFINDKFVEKVCQIIEIKLQQIQGFYGKAAQSISNIIYPTLIICTDTANVFYLLITKLRNNPRILGQLWIKKQRILLIWDTIFQLFGPVIAYTLKVFLPSNQTRLYCS